MGVFGLGVCSRFPVESFWVQSAAVVVCQTLNIDNFDDFDQFPRISGSRRVRRLAHASRGDKRVEHVSAMQTRRGRDGRLGTAHTGESVRLAPDSFLPPASVFLLLPSV